MCIRDRHRVLDVGRVRVGLAVGDDLPQQGDHAVPVLVLDRPDPHAPESTKGISGAGYGRPAYEGVSVGVLAGFVTFPGASFFVMGRRSPIIAAMHDRLRVPRT